MRRFSLKGGEKHTAALYRQIYLSFWTDTKIDEDFTPEDKYFYLYLLTNPHTNLCGCYEIGFKQMARETGYNEDTVKHLVNRMESVHNVIRYNRTTKEVLLLNWWKYNWTESDKLRKGVKASSEVVKSEDFKKYIFSVLDGDIPSEYPMDTVSIPSPYPMHTSVTVTVSDTDTVPASDCSNDFEIFWNEYPRKVGKKEAFRAFKKANMPVQILLSAVREQKQSAMWTKEGGRYIPNPATWLNQGRWDDVLQKPKAGEKNSNGHYTLSNGKETTNPFLAYLDKEVNGEQERNNPDIVLVESGIS